MNFVLTPLHVLFVIYKEIIVPYIFISDDLNTSGLGPFKSGLLQGFLK